ncbi:MAG: methyltransferase domain-containing protein [Leptospiraceae bacterium]|nr:methyltransferase domain-containing protein [Leptospiraceae bacterium]MCP5501087.1 methyltransferase domain-containing protein [Leptospiraceae bacterium]
MNTENKKTDEHFHMGKEYEKYSSSQKAIGRILLESLVEYAKLYLKESNEFSVVDLACGPGNLSIGIKQRLEKEYLNTKINMTGLDYTEDNVKLLIDGSKNSIKGVVGSFFELPLEPESMDIITSNEGLHWQPPYKMDEIIYSHLSGQEKEKYKSWAIGNFTKAIQNIYRVLKKDGIVVVQFGHEGQLQKLWDLIQEVLNEAKFQKYKAKINFPLYYPAEDEIIHAFVQAGFNKGKIEKKSFNQELTEDNPKDITGFLRAFTKPGFKAFFASEDLKLFYSTVRNKLSQMDLNEFRKDQWHRTLIKVRK